MSRLFALKQPCQIEEKAKKGGKGKKTPNHPALHDLGFRQK
jgi:hypothetical protein